MWVRVFVILTALIAAVSLVGSGYLLASGTSDAQDLAQQIQRERKRNVLESCQEINRRHDNTIAALDLLIAKLPPSRRERARQGRASTVLLIEALAPKRQCEAFARRQVGTNY